MAGTRAPQQIIEAILWDLILHESEDVLRVSEVWFRKRHHD